MFIHNFHKDLIFEHILLVSERGDAMKNLSLRFYLLDQFELG
jgi:hypothetical protein